MPPEEPTVEARAGESAPAQESPTLQSTAAAPASAGYVEPPYEPAGEEDEWMEEPLELPRRPRRRLLSPIPLALFGVLITACGFIGGVLVEKGQASSSTSAGAASGLASRFAALRGGAASTGASGG